MIDKELYDYYINTPFNELKSLEEKVFKQQLLQQQFYNLDETSIMGDAYNNFMNYWFPNLSRLGIERNVIQGELSKLNSSLPLQVWQWCIKTKDALGNTVSSLGQAYDYIYNSTAASLETCSNSISAFASGMAQLKNNFLNSVSSTIDWLGNAAEDSVNGGRDIWRVFSKIPTIAEKYKNALWEFKKEKITAIYTAFGNAYQGVVDKADQAVDMVKDAWNTAIKSPTVAAGKVFDKGTDTASGIGKDISDAGSWVAERTPDSIKRGISSIGSGISHGWNNLMVKVGLREPEIDYMVYGKYAIGTFLAIAAVVTIWKLIQRYVNEDGTLKNKNEVVSNVSESYYAPIIINESNVEEAINNITGDYVEKEAIKISVAQDKKILAEKYSSPSFMARMLDNMVKNLLSQPKFINYMKRSSPELLESLKSYNNQPLTESIEELLNNTITINKPTTTNITLDEQINHIIKNSSAFNYYMNTPSNKLQNDNERAIKIAITNKIKEQRLKDV